MKWVPGQGHLSSVFLYLHLSISPSQSVSQSHGHPVLLLGSGFDLTVLGGGLRSHLLPSSKLLEKAQLILLTQ